MWRESRRDQYFPGPAAGTTKVLRSEKAFAVAVVDWNPHTPIVARTHCTHFNRARTESLLGAPSVSLSPLPT